MFKNWICYFSVEIPSVRIFTHTFQITNKKIETLNYYTKTCRCSIVLESVKCSVDVNVAGFLNFSF
jgi:hypothetical protein